MAGLGRPRRAALRGSLVAALVVLAACGDDDDDESSQEAYCEAGSELRTSVGELTDVDLIAEGTDGLQSRLDAIDEDAENLRSAAGEAAEDEVSELQSAVDQLGQALSDVTGSLSRENVSQVGTAVQEVGAAAQGVYESLSDCPE